MSEKITWPSHFYNLLAWKNENWKSSRICRLKPYIYMNKKLRNKNLLAIEKKSTQLLDNKPVSLGLSI